MKRAVRVLGRTAASVRVHPLRAALTQLAHTGEATCNLERYPLQPLQAHSRLLTIYKLTQLLSLYLTLYQSVLYWTNRFSVRAIKTSPRNHYLEKFAN